MVWPCHSAFEWLGPILYILDLSALGLRSSHCFLDFQRQYMQGLQRDAICQCHCFAYVLGVHTLFSDEWSFG